MSVKRVVTIAFGVAAAAGLVVLLRDGGSPPDVRTDPKPAPIRVEVPARPDEAKAPRAEEVSLAVEGTRESPEPPAQSDDGVGGLDATVTEALYPDAPARTFAECKKQGLSLQVCKSWFERRDRKWAPDAEQRISELLADVDLALAQNSASMLGREGPLHCRATYCLIQLELDRTALADLANPTQWATDRAEELQFALVFDGLLEADSEVEAIVFLPADDQEQARPTIWLHRCAETKEGC